MQRLYKRIPRLKFLVIYALAFTHLLNLAYPNLVLAQGKTNSYQPLSSNSAHDEAQRNYVTNLTQSQTDWQRSDWSQPLPLEHIEASTDSIFGTRLTLPFPNIDGASTDFNKEKDRVEIDTYLFKSVSDLKVFEAFIGSHDFNQSSLGLKSDWSADSKFISIDLQSFDEKPSALSQSVDKLIAKASANVNEQNKLSLHSKVSEYIKQNKFNISLSLTRSILNGSVVAWGFIKGDAGVPLQHAVGVGVLAGLMSGLFQLKTDALMTWLKKSDYIIDKAKKIGLIKEGKENSIIEGAIREAVFYSKWATTEVLFLSILNLTLFSLGMPNDLGNIAANVAKGVASQGLFTRGISAVTDALLMSYSEKKEKIKLFKYSALFLGSAINVATSVVAKSLHLENADLSYIILGGTGALLLTVPYVLKNKDKIKDLFSRTLGLNKEPNGAVLSCRALF